MSQFGLLALVKLLLQSKLKRLMLTLEDGSEPTYQKMLPMLPESSMVDQLQRQMQVISLTSLMLMVSLLVEHL
jgi:hypothetical protein